MTASLDALKNGAVLYLDDTRARLEVRGEDRVSWLNGVVSNDVKNIAEGAALYACALTEKGKIIADAVVMPDEGAFGVWVPARVANDLLAAWDRYVIMEDVELARDDARRLLLLQGGAADKIAEAAGLASRGAKLDDLGAHGGLAFDVSRDEAEELERRLMREGAVRIEATAAHVHRVEAARATFGVDFDQKTYVQEAGLEGRAVSFTKGCYHGQEVVCMLENRGKVSRRLVQVEVEGSAAPGDEVTYGGAAIGRVTSAIARESKSVALAMVKAAAAHEGAEVSVGGRTARVVALAR